MLQLSHLLFLVKYKCLIFVGVCLFCFWNLLCVTFLFLTVFFFLRLCCFWNVCCWSAFIMFSCLIVVGISILVHGLVGFYFHNVLLSEIIVYDFDVFRYLFMDFFAFSFIMSCCLKSSSMILTSWLFTAWNHRLWLWLLAYVMFQICCSQWSWSCLISLFVGSPFVVIDFGCKCLVVWNHHLRLCVLAY